MFHRQIVVLSSLVESLLGGNSTSIPVETSSALVAWPSTDVDSAVVVVSNTLKNRGQRQVLSSDNGITLSTVLYPFTTISSQKPTEDHEKRPHGNISHFTVHV